LAIFVIAVALMISSSVIAKQRRYLRHQLREALWKSWLNSYSQTPQNAFSTRTARYQQEEAPQVIVEEKPTTLETDEGPIAVKPGVVVRRADQGRIVGKGGRRQSVVSKRITRNSLDKPSYVVVFRDVDGNERKRPVVGTGGVTPVEVQEIITSPLMPTPEETIASIDALKPPTAPSLVDKAEYKRMMDTLLTGYNTVQLRDYLMHCFNRLKSFPAHVSSHDSVDDDIQSHSIGKWQAGRTPLEQRPKPKAEKKPNAHVKRRMAENILRLAWQVIVTSDASKIGEIEISVKPWELQMLFDMEIDGKPSFHSLLSSEILLQNSEIRPYRPSNVVRITARRQDAEDIARQLRRALFSARRRELDLKTFRALLGQNGWPSRLEELFRDDDLRFVAETAGTLVHRADDNVLVIYAFDVAAENDAQRLFLAHLKKPMPVSHNQIIDAVETMTEGQSDRNFSSQLIGIPCAPDNDHLNRGHRQSNLVRMVKPMARRNRDDSDGARTTAAAEVDKDESHAREKFAEFIEQQLHAVESYTGGTKNVSGHPGSYWGKSIRLRPQNWRAHLCKLLRPADEKEINRSDRAQATSLIPVYEVPGIERLVSYFDSHQKALQQRYRQGIRSRNTFENHRLIERKIDSSLPNLVACFVPSPFTEAGAEIMTRLPTIELRFRVEDSPRRRLDRYGQEQIPRQESRNEIRLIGVRAVLDQQFVSIPLPGEAVDVVFSRPTLMFADQDAIKANTDVASFVREVREVFLADGKLTSSTELPFLLPKWLVQGEKPSADSATEPDVPVQYLFDRFEQVQSHNLELAYKLRQLGALKPEDNKTLTRISKELHFELRQTEGSIVHGKETLLNVRLEPGSRIDASNESKKTSMEESRNAESMNDASSTEDAFSGKADEPAQSTTDVGLRTIEQPKSLLQSLAQTALDVAHLLTRANAGDIPIPYTRTDEGAQQDISKRISYVDDVEAGPDDGLSNWNVAEDDGPDLSTRDRKVVAELFDFPFGPDDKSMPLDEKSENAEDDTGVARATTPSRRNLFDTD
jgi:hypothetical protein